MLDGESSDGLELWHRMNVLGHYTRVAELGNTGCTGEILDHSYTMTLWSLIGTDEAPLRVVELAGRNELSCRLLNRCGDASQVAQG